MISSGINLRQARLLSDAYEVGPPDFDDFSGKEQSTSGLPPGRYQDSSIIPLHK